MLILKKGGAMNQTEIEVALAEHGKEIGSLKHRVDDMEKIADSVHSLAEQMAAQTAEIHHLSENVGGGEGGCGGA